MGVDTTGARGNPLLRAALGYAADGFPVFPCQPRGKVPLVETGFKAATTDPEQISAWWEKWKLANIGMPTGAASDIAVLDVDQPNGEESLAKLRAEHGPLPQTCEVQTGRGRQLWFSFPLIPIRNSAGALGAGLDIRGEGGYVIVPPSIHPNGAHYAFSNDSECEPMPEWLILLASQSKPTAKAAGPSNEGERIPEGRRHAKLTSLAGSLRRQGLSEAEMHATLLDYNARHCDPPMTEAEVSRIAADYAKYPPSAASSPSGTRPEGFSLVGLGELLARPETPVDWLWQDHLAAGTVSGVFSKPKVGKSTFARNLCLAVARGANFLGLPVKKGLCIYLALEERVEDVTADFRAMGATGGEQILIHADAIPATGILALIGLVQERKPVLVVIDPLFRMVRIRDEKAYAETYAALGPLIDVARSIGTHIQVTHHMGKGLKLDPVDSPLGSTGIAGACSSLVVLKRTENYRAIQTVQRLGEWMPETVLQFDADTHRLSLGGTRLEADREECETAILDFLESAADGKTEPEITEAVEGKTRTVRQALRELVKQEKVGRKGEGKRGSPYTYFHFLFSCSQHIVGTREQETQEQGTTRMDTERNLVPERADKPTLVPDIEEGQI